jgi:predicted ArsR family transcriptional regulator
MLSVFDAVNGPVVTTTDVSDVLGITTEAARQKLNGLVRAGDLQRRKTGRTVVYWETAEGADE